MSFVLMVRNLAAFLALICAAKAGAQFPASQVVAESQGIAVAISNWTPFMVNSSFTATATGISGPGFPVSILPYQNTGTGVYLRGGSNSDEYVQMTYEVINGDPESQGLPAFDVWFSAATDWDFKAAAGDVLHTVKKKVTSDTKASIKKTAADSGEDALEAAGAADGMTEAYAALKVMEDIAKFGKALDPTYVMSFGFLPATSATPFYTGESCVAQDQNSPGPANVVIVGPNEEITADNATEFFVLAAGSVNESYPGFVDVSFSPMCDYVCAAWNATSDYLGEYSQSDCTAATSGSTGADSYTAFSNQNVCLVTPADGPNAVAWVSPAPGQTTRWVPPSNCGTPAANSYNSVSTSICGSCPPVESGDPAGSWSESCTLVSFTDTTLCADCASADSPEVTTSCAACSTEVWNNDNGTLVCDTSAPPGSWLESCDSSDYVYNGTAQSLCATCSTDDAAESYSCQVCSSNTWSNVNGQLVCAAAAAEEPPSYEAPPSCGVFPSGPLPELFASSHLVNLSKPLLGAIR